MSDLSYNNLFRLVDDNKTFTEIGDPQNVLKTAVIINFLMIVMTVSMCMIPIPFMMPIVIIIYIITFCILNIKYMRDFAMAVYQGDNIQIQSTKINYDNSTNKTTDIKELVDENLEDNFQTVTNIDSVLNDFYTNTFQNT
jgi:hypothetical protein